MCLLFGEWEGCEEDPFAGRQDVKVDGRTEVCNQEKIAVGEFEEVDKEINRVWGVLKSQLSEDEMKELTKEQIAWIKTKESGCKEEADRRFGKNADDLRGTSLWKAFQNRCFKEKTEERTAQLKELL